MMVRLPASTPSPARTLHSIPLPLDARKLKSGARRCPRLSGRRKQMRMVYLSERASE